MNVAVVIALVYAGILSVSCYEKLVIDTDGGADDAAAIILALSAWEKRDSDFEVVAITCVNGNSKIKTVETNVLKSVTIANSSYVKIYARGAEKPIVENYATDNYFGKDGLGDFQFLEKISAKADRTTFAPIALINLAQRYPGKLSILSLGPLTNIALAAAIDSTFIPNLKRLYIMGASVAGVGNVAPGFEFNFKVDPESNFIVLNHTSKEPSVLFPWETVLNAGISADWRINVLGALNSRTMNFLNKAESKPLQSSSTLWTPADLMTVAVVIWPHLKQKSLVTNGTPVIDGLAKGTILVDYVNNSGKPKNVEIVQGFQVDEFKKKLLYHFS